MDNISTMYLIVQWRVVSFPSLSQDIPGEVTDPKVNTTNYSPFSHLNIGYLQQETCPPITFFNLLGHCLRVVPNWVKKS
jgi:hypothetical protein